MDIVKRMSLLLRHSLFVIDGEENKKKHSGGTSAFTLGGEN